MKKQYLFVNPLIAALASVFIITNASAKESKIGASLNKKVELSIAELPQQVTDVINQARPGFVVKEAEKEYKHGNVYIDVEGLDKDGNEIEFDLLKQNNRWQIVEIQRDLTLKQTPDIVVAALKSEQPNIQPKRIIESEQVTGKQANRVIIYEFYTVNPSSGDEKKFEVKLSAGKAELLKHEWQH
ncbi:hypothetical protein [Catenovulum adriaticum]|uniref:Peptidase YpeB-like protein n=1 Tax=Catenovulum adriaticum TaxID=2984846 RepID=A0ABY7ASB4_9ALTE|nr:hypothetical protein [Catenovulum sp. TS8]WAJ72158.1 hypothetical protein OLW01_17930 [Catenovulum sp. TS8]